MNVYEFVGVVEVVAGVEADDDEFGVEGEGFGQQEEAVDGAVAAEGHVVDGPVESVFELSRPGVVGGDVGAVGVGIAEGDDGRGGGDGGIAEAVGVVIGVGGVRAVAEARVGEHDGGDGGGGRGAWFPGRGEDGVDAGRDQ